METMKNLLGFKKKIVDRVQSNSMKEQKGKINSNIISVKELKELAELATVVPYTFRTYPITIWIPGVVMLLFGFLNTYLYIYEIAVEEYL